MMDTITELKKCVNNLSTLGEISEKAKEELNSSCERLEEHWGKKLDRLYSLSETDVLGDWPNRRGLFKRAERVIAEYNRDTYQSVCVAFIDFDKFKSINDTYGHTYGDEVLIAMANVISSSIRKVDVYGRLSGDEFVVVLPGASIKGARLTLGRIKEKLRSINFSFNAEKRLTISFTFGIALTEAKQGRKKALTFEELLHKADEAMTNRKGDRSRQR